MAILEVDGMKVIYDSHTPKGKASFFFEGGSDLPSAVKLDWNMMNNSREEVEKFVRSRWSIAIARATSKD